MSTPGTWHVEVLVRRQGQDDVRMTLTLKPTSAEPTQSANDTVGGEALADLKRMATAWAEAKSYRMKLRGSEDGHYFVVLLEVVRPDREHIKVTGGGQWEAIRIGKDVYSNLDGEWTKQEPNALPNDLGLNSGKVMAGFERTISSGAKITKSDRIEVDGKPCQQWIITAKDPNESGSMCIGITDSLPVETKSADGNYTIRFYDWNAPITINPPS